MTDFGAISKKPGVLPEFPSIKSRSNSNQYPILAAIEGEEFHCCRAAFSSRFCAHVCGRIGLRSRQPWRVTNGSCRFGSPAKRWRRPLRSPQTQRNLYRSSSGRWSLLIIGFYIVTRQSGNTVQHRRTTFHRPLPLHISAPDRLQRRLKRTAAASVPTPSERSPYLRRPQSCRANRPANTTGPSGSCSTSVATGPVASGWPGTAGRLFGWGGWRGRDCGRRSTDSGSEGVDGAAAVVSGALEAALEALMW